MNVIVKGMKMPDCCGLCELSDIEDEGVRCNPLGKFMWFWLDEVPDGRLPNCPLVELIQCKECKHWKSEYAEVGGCDMFKSAGIRCSTISDFFCAMATPKEKDK